MKLVISGKYTGDLIGSTLTKRGRQVVLFRAMDGFGLAKHLITNPRVKHIRLEYKGRLYKTTADQWLRHGIPFWRPPYEPQLILPRRYFDIIDNRQEMLF